MPECFSGYFALASAGRTIHDYGSWGCPDSQDYLKLRQGASEMSKSNSLTMFSHIVSRFTDHTEDVAVEALGYILSRSDSARRALRDMLQVEGLDIPELTDAATQVSGEEGDRPDLVVWDRGRAERVLIEAKFWAGLTENQPNAYLVLVRKLRFLIDPLFVDSARFAAMGSPLGGFSLCGKGLRDFRLDPAAWGRSLHDKAEAAPRRSVPVLECSFPGVFGRISRAAAARSAPDCARTRRIAPRP